MPTRQRSKSLNRPWLSVAVFLAVAFGSTWLLWSSRWLGFDWPQGALEALSMVCVAGAVAVAVLLVERPKSVVSATAMRLPQPRRFFLIGFGLLPVLGLIALSLGWLTGSYAPDLADFSGLRATFAPGSVGEQGIPWGLIGSTLATTLLLFAVTLPLMWCEEWGWRGFLLPRLTRFGIWPALIASSLIWALWHLPIYLSPGGRDLSSLAPFLAQALMLGLVLGWLRIASGSIWPAVLAHGANNAIIGVMNAFFADADYLQRDDLNLYMGLNGWLGWVVMAFAVVLLARYGNFHSARRELSDVRLATKGRV